jgi:hypothetical protein
MIESIIMDMDYDIIESDYDEEFLKEWGILNMIDTGNILDNGYKDMMVIFKNKEFRDLYIKEFDITFNEVIIDKKIKSSDDV